MKDEIIFGQERPRKGIEGVTSHIIETLQKMMDEPMFGNQKEATSALLDYVKAREKHGKDKYGTTLETWNGRDPLQDVIEEDVDRFQYLVQARKERADMLETIAELKRKNTKLERDLDEANRAVQAVAAQIATPGAGVGQALEAGSSAPGAHRDALLQHLCSTGQLPENRRPDTRDAFKDLFLACYANSALHGFWGQEAEDAIKARMIVGYTDNVIPEKLALMHSELSEALEAYREKGTDETGGWLDSITEKGKPEGFIPELVDVLIRIGDLVGAMHMEERFVSALFAKMKYNASRPRMHGKVC